MALTYVVDASVDNAIDQVLTSVAGGVPALAGHLIWSGIWSTFFAILAVVTYHDLRVPGKVSRPRRSRWCSNDVAFDGAAPPLHNTTALEEDDVRHRGCAPNKSGEIMTEAALQSARFAAGEFRIGSVLNRT